MRESQHFWLSLVKRESRRALCALLAVVTAATPVYQMTVWGTTFALLNSPLLALAQTPPPEEEPVLPPRGSSDPLPDTAPAGAQDGKALGESLLTGPATNGNKIFFNGESGTESINVSDIFQSGGSPDDVAAMQDAFGDDNAALALSTAAAARMSTENSQHANAYNTVRDSELTHSHPDLIKDPVFTRSTDVLSGDDPIFSTFFAGCESNTVPLNPDTTVHVPDPHWCSRVVLPAQHCEVKHDYEASLVQFVSGEGGIQSCGDGCLDVYVGKVGDNYWTGTCAIFEQDVHLQVDNPDAIVSATLAEAQWDDYMQIYIADKKIWAGPNDNFPPETPGPCELNTSWVQTPNVDLTQQFKAGGLLKFLVRVSVTKGGEGYARIRLMYDQNKVVTKDQWNITPECDALLDGLSDGACTLTSMNCLDGPPMDTLCISTDNGYVVCQGALSPGPLPGYSPLCKRGEINGNCNFMTGPMQCWTDPQGVQHCPTNDGNNPDGCTMFEDDPKCGFVSSTCLDFAKGASGRCYAFEEKWDCGTDVTMPGGSTAHVTCDGPIRCMGEECVSPKRETNADFGKAAGALTAMNFMAMDMNCSDTNPDTCSIFAGEPMECKSALGGYQDCCNTPVGTSMSDYLNFTLASYNLAKKLELGKKLQSLGLDVSGAWKQVSSAVVDTVTDNVITNSATWQELTQPITSAWDSLAEVYGKVKAEAIDTLGIDQLEQTIMRNTMEWVSENFSPQVANMFFSEGVNEAGESVISLSENVVAVMNFIMWVYAIYVILNILIQIIWACEEEEFTLAMRREIKACTYIGTYCYDDSVFGCIEKRTSYCCYNSPLARIVMEGAVQQLHLEIGTPETPDCKGLTIAQVAALDWSQINLGEWFGILASNGIIPNGTADFDDKYSLDKVTRNPYSPNDTPSTPERVQDFIDAGKYFDQVRADTREDLWDSAH
jgi:conjugal transfer mating pair stabilization protein TraN